MRVVELLRSYLVADVGVKALAYDRIYANKLDQKAALPAAFLRSSRIVPMVTQDGVGGRSQFSLLCYTEATTYTAASGLADAITVALHRYPLRPVDNEFHYLNVSRERDLLMRTAEASSEPRHRVTLVITGFFGG